MMGVPPFPGDEMLNWSVTQSPTADPILLAAAAEAEVAATTVDVTAEASTKVVKSNRIRQILVSALQIV